MLMTTKEMLTLLIVAPMFLPNASVSLNALTSKTFTDSTLTIQLQPKLWPKTQLEQVTGLLKETVLTQ